MNLVKEKQIYESLGVKNFKSIIMGNSQMGEHLFKEKIGNQGLSSLTMEGIEEYKKKIIFNAKAHGIGVGALAIPIADGNLSALIPFAINGYFVMLQRYNYIRIVLLEEKYKQLQQRKEEKKEIPIKKFEIPQMKSMKEIKAQPAISTGQLIKVAKKRA